MRKRRQIIPNADIDVAEKHKAGVNQKRQKQQQKTAITFRDELVGSPAQGDKRNQQEGKGGLEREGNRKVIPPTRATVLPQQRGRMPFVVMPNLPEDPQYKVGGHNVRS